MTWRLPAGAAIIACAPVLVKAVSLGPTAAALYRCLIAAAALGLWLALSPAARPAPGVRRSGRYGRAVLGAGLFFALDLTVWHRSVLWCGAGLSTILANTQVFYMALAGALWFGERPTRRLAAAVPAAFLGVTMLAARGGGAAGPGDRYAAGVALGLLTGLFYTGYLLCLRRAEREAGEGGTPALLASVSAVTAGFLFLFCLAEGELPLPSGRDWLWTALLGLGPQASGWMLISRGLRETPVSRAGLVLLLQPVLAVALGAAIFGERFTVVQGAGAALTLAAVYLGATRNA